MFRITVQYFPINFDVAFLRIKQQYIHFAHYRIAFYTHVIFSVFSLFAGFTQFSKTIRTKYTRIHRIAGWIYLVSILVFAAPSGLVIGYYANGGFWSQLAFCLLAVGWFWFSLQAILALRQKEYQKHQIFMIRSFALTLSAITLRLWKYLIVLVFQPRPMDVYQIVAWLGWVLNLIIAEIIILKYIKNKA
ncbi:DUF2306 domain-containing protein [Aquimarina mytili]|uniref:DUF2306 domain-containing protein n=1 Tax=Aquimarina mytili TaxID=874423 RepID=A0A936ZW54_9FLAO|nr:DUF2306 domain-containing protein [Aquimarina mytili]MBL0685402.1 DUF2306 domain-containing protein [Aquimarina mytili]